MTPQKSAPRKLGRFYPSIREALDDLRPVIDDRIKNGVQLRQIIDLLEARLGVPATTLEIYLRGATSPQPTYRSADPSKPARRRR